MIWFLKYSPKLYK